MAEPKPIFDPKGCRAGAHTLCVAASSGAATKSSTFVASQDRMGNLLAAESASERNGRP